MELKEFNVWEHNLVVLEAEAEALKFLRNKLSTRMCCLISIYLAKWCVKILADKWPEEKLLWENVQKLIVETEAIFEDFPNALYSPAVKSYKERMADDYRIFGIMTHPAMPICFLLVYHIVIMSKTTDKPAKEEEHELLTSILYWITDEIENHNYSNDQNKLEMHFYRIRVSQLLSLFLPLENWHSNWHTTTTTQLAKTIYNNKDWSLCPILADALMDAGCEDEYVLWLLKEQHHLFARGVWLIDQLAGNL